MKTRSNSQIISSFCRTTASQQSLKFVVPKIWNTIPPAIRDCQSSSIFKRKLTQHLLNRSQIGYLNKSNSVHMLINLFCCLFVIFDFDFQRDRYPPLQYLFSGSKTWPEDYSNSFSSYSTIVHVYILRLHLLYISLSFHCNLNYDIVLI